MSELIKILFLVLFIAGFVGIAALWTQRNINRKREKDAKASEAGDDASPKTK